MTNLVRHVKSCEGQVVDDSKSIASYAQGSTYNKAELRYLVSRWVFKCHWPFAIIDDEPLQCIFKMLYAKVKTPSATTILQDVKEIHGISKVHVGKFLQVSHDIFMPPTKFNVSNSLTPPRRSTLGGYTLDLTAGLP